MHIFRATLLLCFVSLVGCRLEIVVPEYGRVETASGAYSCEASTICEIDITDTYFNETFIGEPGDGYYFAGWLRGPSRLCSGLDGHCALATSFFEGNEILEAILASDRTWRIEPYFAPVDAIQAIGIAQDPVGDGNKISLGTNDNLLGSDLVEPKIELKDNLLTFYPGFRPESFSAEDSVAIFYIDTDQNEDTGLAPLCGFVAGSEFRVYMRNERLFVTKYSGSGCPGIQVWDGPNQLPLGVLEDDGLFAFRVSSFEFFPDTDCCSSGDIDYAPDRDKPKAIMTTVRSDAEDSDS